MCTPQQYCPVARSFACPVPTYEGRFYGRPTCGRRRSAHGARFLARHFQRVGVRHVSLRVISGCHTLVLSSPKSFPKANPLESPVSVGEADGPDYVIERGCEEARDAEEVNRVRGARRKVKVPKQAADWVEWRGNWHRFKPSPPLRPICACPLKPGHLMRPWPAGPCSFPCTSSGSIDVGGCCSYLWPLGQWVADQLEPWF